MDSEQTWTGAQVIAFNLRRARDLRAMTQDEVVQRLADYGMDMSRAAYSFAERTVAGRRMRQFTFDDVLVFSRVFDLPPAWFLLPPDGSPIAVGDRGDEVGAADLARDVAAPHLHGPEFRRRLDELLIVLSGQGADRAVLDDLGQLIEQGAMHSAGLALARRAGDIGRWRDVLAQLDAVMGEWQERLAEAEPTIDLSGKTQLVEAMNRRQGGSDDD